MAVLCISSGMYCAFAALSVLLLLLLVTLFLVVVVAVFFWLTDDMHHEPTLHPGFWHDIFFSISVILSSKVLFCSWCTLKVEFRMLKKFFLLLLQSSFCFSFCKMVLIQLYFIISTLLQLECFEWYFPCFLTPFNNNHNGRSPPLQWRISFCFWMESICDGVFSCYLIERNNTIEVG